MCLFLCFFFFFLNLVLNCKSLKTYENEKKINWKEKRWKCFLCNKKVHRLKILSIISSNLRTISFYFYYRVCCCVLCIECMQCTHVCTTITIQSGSYVVEIDILLAICFFFFNFFLSKIKFYFWSYSSCSFIYICVYYLVVQVRWDGGGVFHSKNWASFLLCSLACCVFAYMPICQCLN